jgi:glutamine amidotransferase
MNSDGVILPGVGAFGDAMDNLKRLDLINPIKDFIGSGKPLMGICLGMQLLMSESEEFGKREGLDIIKGAVVKFPAIDDKGNKSKVPQVGWNGIHRSRIGEDDVWDGTPLQDINESEFMYFVHSFYVVPANKTVMLSVTDYEGTQFCSSIAWKNIFAFQFHPEKSAQEGIKIYKNWASIIRRDKEIRR